MSHPDLAAPPDTRPIEVGEVWENPVTLERAVLLELPWTNAEGRAVVRLSAVPGARVAAAHLHPALVERFSVESGELTLERDGARSVLRAGERAEIAAGVWHDWWNEGAEEALARVEIEPGERFLHMIETIFGLGREGHLNDRGLPHPLQMALLAPEFQDVIVFRRPPVAVQRALFGALAPIARRKGYRATYPSLSRTTLAARGTPAP